MSYRYTYQLVRDGLDAKIGPDLRSLVEDYMSSTFAHLDQLGCPPFLHLRSSAGCGSSNLHRLREAHISVY
jgi:hypothetical protein